jgi:tetratricopeptide (TPR) repeat protein
MHEFYIPRSVQDAVQRRIEQLHPSALNILRLAAVAGRRFDFTLLQSLTHDSEEQLLESMKELVQAQLVIEESEDQFAFRHALTRQAIYKDLLVRERKLRHLAIAETLEQLHAHALDAHVGELASHFYRARAWQKTVYYARLAGEQAMMLYASRSAIDYFSWAVESAGHLPDAATVSLYRVRGQAYETLGEFEAARQDYTRSLEAARKLDDRNAEWQNMLDLGFLWAARDYGQAEAWFRQALSLAQTLSDSLLEARSLNRIGNWYLNVEQHLDAQTYHKQALAIFEELNDAQGIAETLDLLGMTCYLGGDLVQGTIYYRQAISCFETLNDRVGLTSSLATLALGAATYQTDAMVVAATSLADVVQDVERGLRIAREIGLRSAETYALFQLGLCLGSQGEFSKALESLQQAYEIAEETGHRQWQTAIYSVMGGLYQSVLAYTQAREYLEQGLSIARDIKSLTWINMIAGYLVATYGALREPLLVEKLLAETVQVDTPARTMAQRLIWSGRAELALSMRNPQKALEIIEHLQADGAQAGAGKVALRIEKLRGEALLVQRNYIGAEDALCAAQKIAREQGARPVLWRIVVQLGMLYKEQGRREEAGEAFSQARELIGELTKAIEEESLQKEFLHRATAMLPAQYREEVVSTRQEAKKATGGLTPREYEIAVLISKGRSNQELADALIVTKRTIETHIGNIMFKLGVNSRVQIAAWLLEKGLNGRAE